ncbi:hypothetical protein DL766_008086 [Monosporascus sp. MC13-8B]|uniref:Rhodopsin domain-containing protein n=1 Tax=Monosporascus cannonballus TaxID=155416 RepID=A0ABY0HG90_9PEZI|nr:hypothetical protein DL763_006968 [Monosporascus cannonballus]RYO91100.1 hypothetical protein DL762_002396 [Monosporascus cannonballus]RYP20820.1 hypothetical protein DL766_008086 [Monosporascus sp. MC13-8B]
MSLYSSPPSLHTPDQDKPTLLVCWWITLFSMTIILLRVSGRFVRTERLFKEDKMAALAIIPLFLRMGCVHLILLYGTNNTRFSAHRLPLPDEEMRRRTIGSGLVLASRIFYAATLWILKNAILEFFKRLTSTTWTRSHELTLLFIRVTLVLTFLAVLISDLAECQPFHNYWQVLPDPGGRCRQGYAQLITMASCNVITDLLLVFFPVPIILKSHMKKKKKVQLVLLFSLSLGVVAITLYRVPHVVWAHGSQQTRSLLASIEIFSATCAANALVLGSFVRDRGVKKMKFRRTSVAADSIDQVYNRRPTIHRHWGSDEDLVRDLGLGVNRELRDERQGVGGRSSTIPQFSPAPVAGVAEDMNNWRFPQRRRGNEEHSDDTLLAREPLSASRSKSSTTPRRVSFFDVGGLLESEPSRSTRDSFNSTLDPVSPRYTPTPTMTATPTGYRRGSQTLLRDLGSLFGSRQSKANARAATELQPIPQHPGEHRCEEHSGIPDLVDVGGLLK